ncbi:hypothetical protein OIE62_17350 [Streptomyces scopuliridis]|uniref:Uncharacterized protein n=1 Tax=Streptomyces scopuliridis TaxID=452529 RepID=A0ACD4ZRI5_9ACTN|nr:hypothetical protein [Streptomyces scopuliridis]WSB99691.1 hypothetical protein OG835_23605 [Streptomyces scopuliridis]WSC06610.1 hypothetical protein OIE62_17350 [Streptomyces scopuliridis]
MPELARIANRPDVFPDGLLSVFYIEVEAWNEAEVFGRRLRELVGAGVKAGLEADFESETISEADVPAWAADAWAEAAPRYAAQRGDEEWTVQDLLYSFDPRQRTWSWWDVTAVSGNIVCMWIDSRGEAVYGCEELRWMVYAAGARSVVGPLLREVGEWERSTSLGNNS